MSEKISCGIARDLMPLVIDDACGEESRLAVEGHVAGCEECAKVYEAMKAELPKPAADEKENAHFAQSMKKTRRKSRWIKAVCAVLAAILLIVIGYFAVNPKPLFAEKTTAPVSWFHNAHLERTSNNHLALRFTPDERYKMYMGSFPSVTELTDGLMLDISFNYSKLAKDMNLMPVTDDDEPWQWFEALFKYNGDWVIPLNVVSWDCRYVDGKIWKGFWRELTEEEKKKLPEGVSGYIYDYAPDGEYGEWKKVVISDDHETLVVYDGTQEIPLCDPELEERINYVGGPEIGEFSTSMGP